MRIVRGRALVAVLLTFGLLAAACGDDEEPATTPAPADDGAAAAAQAEVDAAQAAAKAAQAEAEAAQAALEAAEAAAAEASAEQQAEAQAALEAAQAEVEAAQAEAEAAQAALEAAAEQEMALPGEGVTVTMARGNWKETNFQNYVVQLLLEELGYEVTDPEEIAPATFYPALAQGDYDLWASSWPLNHTPLLEGESPDGGTFGDRVQYIGTMMASGALQGLLVDIPSVEQYGFTTLGELLDNPDAVAHFDTDGDGKADLNGCDDGWGCQKVMNDTIAKNGWDDRIAQVSATHSALFAESQASFETGGPVLQYVWTPTAFVGKLVPGRDVLWLAIEPDQALEGQDGVSAVGDACTNDPCTTMFTPSDIVVTANNDFLAANPAAASLLANFEIDPLAVAVQAVAIDAGANPNDDMVAAAAEWIAANRDVIDPWIAAALAAG
ncbi:MAG: glycine betaine/L-proline ABC transporter substrate-binding protein ProX [Acidimicrobiaceae bacterium]|nr:glycine betaine/L-proline ABC transporter substrate-binding protein ProX [Acidimicrobiaceae bacterium]